MLYLIESVINITQDQVQVASLRSSNPYLALTKKVKFSVKSPKEEVDISIVMP